MSTFSKMKVSFNNKNERITVNITTEKINNGKEPKFINSESHPKLDKMVTKYRHLTWLAEEDESPLNPAFLKSRHDMIKETYPKEYAKVNGPNNKYHRGFNEGAMSILRMLQDYPEAFYDESFLKDDESFLEDSDEYEEEQPLITYDEWKQSSDYRRTRQCSEEKKEEKKDEKEESEFYKQWKKDATEAKARFSKNIGK